MPTLDDRAIARWRLHTQRLVGPPWPDPAAVVDGLLGVQAENQAQALWALACRAGDVAEPTVLQALDEGRILRTHVLRPTWHFVTSADIAWLLALTGPRIQRAARQVQASVGVTEDVLAAGLEVQASALADGVHRTREEMGMVLAEAGLPGEGLPLGLLLSHAELEGVTCSGATRDGAHTWALLAQRAPDARHLDREAAMAELALRYVSGHGPATDRDLAYWATLTLTDVRAGLAAAGDALASFEHDGRTWWHRADAEPPGAAADPTAGLGADAADDPPGHLLQILDELYRGYQDSRWVLDAAGLAERGRTATTGMAVVGGQVLGEMRRTLRTASVTFEVTPLRPLTAEEIDILTAAADRYAAWLGLDPVLEVAA